MFIYCLHAYFPILWGCLLGSISAAGFILKQVSFLYFFLLWLFLPPLFCNSDIQFDDIGPYMQEYVKHQGLSEKPRRLLVSGMRAQRILLSSPYLKWLLHKGLEVTKIYQVIEYAPKRCFRKFVQQVSDARRSGDGDKDQKIIAETMKLIGNSGYGSLIMDKEKHLYTDYAEGRGSAQIKINDPRFKKCTAIEDDLFEVEMAKSKITFDLPIQLGYHILQLAKLRMLQFRYDCLGQYCDVKDFEYLEMDTDSAYIAIQGKSLEDMVLPHKRQELLYQKMGQCREFDYTSEDGFFPRECCQKHIAYDKRTPGLFKVEAEGKAMIALCSKTYILKKHNDEDKFSSKGLNKRSVKNPMESFQTVLRTRRPQSSTNQGFRTRGNSIYTYQQTKGGLSYFYCKREVLADGIHTIPLTIMLTPWPKRSIELVDDDHPWKLDKPHEFIIDGKRYGSLADVCSAAYRQADMINIMHAAISQLTRHIPTGRVIFPLAASLKKRDEWKHDTFWTTGMSTQSSCLRLNTPGQNKLGSLVENFMNAHIMDHDYV